jgi:hypothetical protein
MRPEGLAGRIVGWLMETVNAPAYELALRILAAISGSGAGPWSAPSATHGEAGSASEFGLRPTSRLPQFRELLQVVSLPGPGPDPGQGDHAERVLYKLGFR